MKYRGLSSYSLFAVTILHNKNKPRLYASTKRVDFGAVQTSGEIPRAGKIYSDFYESFISSLRGNTYFL